MKSQAGFKVGVSDRSGDDSRYKKEMPGPGAYETSKSTMNKLDLSNRFGSQKRLTLNVDTNMPGPGQYEQKSYYNGSQPN